MRFPLQYLNIEFLLKMSKWNKPAKQPTQQFLQNQERRRQMIIQASKRRRQKQKKLQQLNENLKKNQQQAIQKHKKQKQEVYQKYLRSNNNMHDKYQQIKRNQKMQEETKKQVSKWKKRDNSAETKTIEGLDLQKSQGKHKKEQQNKKTVKDQVVRKGIQAKKAVQQQFQKQWGQQDQQLPQQLLGSKLLDSLDLDIDTMQRGRQLTDKLQQIKKLQDKPTIQKDEVQQIKNLIGYESLLVSYDNQTQQPTIKQTVSAKNIGSKPASNSNSNSNLNTNKNTKLKQDKKQVNEQQTFNNLKNKKEGKILQWATNKVEEADDLFSNCSSNKNIMKNNVRDNSKDSKGQKKGLEPIPEKRNKSVNRSFEKDKKSTQKPPNTPSIPPPSQKVVAHVKNNSQNQFKSGKQIRQSDQRKKVLSREKQQKIAQIPKRASQINNENRSQNRSVSKQKVKQNQAAFQKDKQKSLQKLRQRRFSGQRPTGQRAGAERTSSAQKPRNTPTPLPQIPKTQQPFRSQKPLPPMAPKPAYTVATHQQYFDVQSFIMNDLVILNQEQRKLQQQIRNIHIQNKQKVKEVQNKYQIKTNYKNSNSLINRHEGKEEDEEEGRGYGKIHAVVNEDDIEESIQRLDDLLIKRDFYSRERTHISEESNIKSIINPMSRPQDLQKQILQLAQNISKFQNQQQKDPRGYGFQHKMKKKPQKLQIPQQISVSRNVDEATLQRQHKKSLQKQKQKQSRNKLKMPNPPLLEYSSKDNEIVQVNMQQQYYDPEDSLDTMKKMNKQKIQVNQKLRNMLFDD